jgi:glycosyltransferase involved in cell wall biosynthesis
MRVLIVSHPCVIEANQAAYVALGDLGWDVSLVVPNRWRNAFCPDGFSPTIAPTLRASARKLPVMFQGAPQRYVYRVRAARIIASSRPDVAFIEQEPVSMSAAQWSIPLKRAGIPFGLQQAENLERAQPLPARLARKATLSRASFVAARSPRAAGLVNNEYPGLPAPVIPHPVLEWEPVTRRTTSVFTVGYAGRLVEEKGLRDLVAATGELSDSVLLFVGDGPMREELAAASTARRPVEVRTGVAHLEMAKAYADMDVLVLPSRTTPSWAEQFGRVLVEALACGVPLVGSDSGEIPWVIETTRGGTVYPEGDIVALKDALARLQADPGYARRLAETGARSVSLTFTTEAVAGQFDAWLRKAVRGRSEADR